MVAPMERVIQVLNRMQSDGVVENYAIGGGIAAIYYLEPYDTDDIDVFIPAVAVTVGEAGLISLEPVYDYLKTLGYLPLKEGVLIEDWLVQFIPTFEPMQEEAISKSRRVTYGETETNIFTADYLAAELLRSDSAWILAGTNCISVPAFGRISSSLTPSKRYLIPPITL